MTRNFCPTCGEQLPPDAKFCPGCGISLSDGHVDNPPSPSPYAAPVASPTYRGRSKTTAVILALFFGSFSYLYIAKTHSGYLVQSVFVLVILGGVGIGIMSAAEGPGGALFGLALTLIAGFIWGVAPLIFFAIKPQAWFEQWDRNHGET